jgi:hypothetical protein
MAVVRAFTGAVAQPSDAALRMPQWGVGIDAAGRVAWSRCTRNARQCTTPFDAPERAKIVADSRALGDHPRDAM